jgi:hypothetical protein
MRTSSRWVLLPMALLVIAASSSGVTAEAGETGGGQQAATDHLGVGQTEHVGLKQSAPAAAMSPSINNVTGRPLSRNDVEAVRSSLSEGWSGWASEGGVLTSNIAVGQNEDGRLEAFVRGTDQALWHKWQTAPNSGWSGWLSEGGVLTSDIAVGHNADGHLEVFVRGTDNALWHNWQTT